MKVFVSIITLLIAIFLIRIQRFFEKGGKL